ncbi:GH12 family glycosyl hydrolase domain-containing protein [Streptomyces sp. NPDC004014]
MQLFHRTTPSRAGLTATVLAGLMLTGVAVSPAQAATQQNCDVEGTVMYGKYYAHNSEWGNTYNGWGYGNQCVSHDDEQGGNNWASSFNWYNNGSISDDEWHIKAFPSVVSGWQWGYANPDHGGFPVRLGDGHNIVTNWDFSVNASDWKGDSIYDLWIDPSQNPSGQPQNEVMVFLNYSEGTIPSSSDKVATVDLGGATWDVYRSYGSWQVISFVRTQQTSNVSNMNLRDFMDYSTNSGWLDPSLYLVSVQAGHEIWRGSGSTSTSNYSVDVS